MRVLILRLASCMLSISIVEPSFAASPPWNPPQVAPTVTVNATGSTMIAPDRAVIRISIQSEAMTSAAAATENAQTTQAVTTALRRTGVNPKDLSTENYLVQPRWRYSPSAPPRRVGYEASSLLRLQNAPLSKLGTWIDAALRAGAAGVGEPIFSASDEATARAQALSEALRQAQSDAQALAGAAGGSLGPLLEITTVPSGPTPGMRQFTITAARVAPEVQPTTISPPLLQIEATVTARWAFVPGR